MGIYVRIPSMTAVPTADGPARPWAALPGQVLAFSLLFSLISISLTESFLFLAVILWAVRLLVEKRNFSAPTFFIPLLVYSALSLVSSAFSVNAAISFRDCRELALYLMIPVAYVSLRGLREVRRVNYAVFASAAASILYTFYRGLFLAAPEERIKGFMGHYMTQAGLLAMFASLAMAMAIFGKGKARYVWGAGALAAGAALQMTLTRSAWIGVAVAACVLVFIWKPKFVLVVPVLVVIIFIASPAAVKKRALSIFTLQGFSNRMRVEYLRAGAGIIRDYPLFGTGPDTVDMVFQNPRYGLSDEARRNVHLHNTVVQIAAERGLPALAAWLAFVVWIAVSLVKVVRARDPDRLPLAAGGLAALTVMVVAGLFEYNFGDSEILILFLYLITMPFAGKESAS
jgi:O-antigen ligase